MTNNTGIETNGHGNAHNNGDSHTATNGSKTSVPLTNGYLKGKSVRTVYGLVPLEYALDWPVFASYEELHGCAKYIGGRIPTADEARSIYTYVDGLKRKDLGQRTATIPAVNG